MKGVVKPHAIPMSRKPKMYLMIVLGGSARAVGSWADMLRGGSTDE